MKKIFPLFFVLLFCQQEVLSQCWQKIASKHNHVLAISVDGTLWQWGNKAFRIPTLLDSSTNWVDISTGERFYAGIQADGSLWTWGSNSYGQLGNGTATSHLLPRKLGTGTNWKQVSCGEDHVAAIKTDGTLWLWGRNNNGQLGGGLSRISSNIPVQLGNATDWAEVSAGKNHTLIKKRSPSLWFVGACYSSSLLSQLSRVGSSSSSWKTMSGGSFTDYGIKSNGTLWKWTNSNGRNTNPSQVGSDTNWEKIDNSHAYSPEYHALFLKTDGTLWAVGKNNFGQLGDSSLSDRRLPVQIGVATDWKSIVAGSHYSLAIKDDFSVWAWGRNILAQFGNGQSRRTPLPIDTNAIWKSATSSTASRSGHTLAIQDNGSLWAWGQNNDGQLGNGSTYTHKALPIQVGTDSSWRSTTNGFFFSIGIKTNGTLWAWGRNGRGQLGLGASIFRKTVPTLVGTDSNWAMASAGGEFVIALKNNGTLWAWGHNSYGQLGDGTTNPIFRPTQVGVDSNWVAISTGTDHVLALKSDSSLWTWGRNSFGQIGRFGNLKIPVRLGTDTWKTISGGGLHSLGIKTDSTLWAWGRNLYAQLGDNSTSNRSRPVQIGSQHTWRTVAGGYQHSLATKIDSSLWAWGRNGAGQVADSTDYKIYLPVRILRQDDWKAINGGPTNSIAITSSGTLYTFGDSYSADFQINFPQLGYVYWQPIELSICNYCPPSNTLLTASLCQGDSILYNGMYITSVGAYSNTLTNSSGCDSIITFNVIAGETYDTINPAACVNYTTASGILLTTAGVFLDTVTNARGCDSILTIYLTLNQTYDTIYQTVCASYIAPSGNRLDSSGIYLDIIPNTKGCDSMISIYLTVTNTYSVIDVIECASYTSPSGNVYATAGTFMDTIPNAAGCDSIITLNLTLNQSYNLLNELACRTYTAPSGTVFFTSGTYSDTINNSIGCDSIITIQLTIVRYDSVSQNGIVLTANEPNAAYQWLDCNNNYQILTGETSQTFTATTNGSYAVEVNKNTCIDTSACIMISTVGITGNSIFSRVSIFPNPNDGLVNIHLGNLRSVTVKVLNIYGQVIYFEEQINSSIYQLEFNVAKGVYLIEVIAQGKSKKYKVLKK